MAINHQTGTIVTFFFFFLYVEIKFQIYYLTIKHVSNWASRNFFLKIFFYLQINLSRHGNIYGPLPIGHHSNFKIATNFWLTYNERKNKFMKYKEGWLSAASIVFERNFLLFSFFLWERSSKETWPCRKEKKKSCQSSSIVILTIPTYRRIICMVAKKTYYFRLLNYLIQS